MCFENKDTFEKFFIYMFFPLYWSHVINRVVTFCQVISESTFASYVQVGF